MEAKEKAKSLYDKFYNKNTVWIDEENFYSSPKKTVECALIAIDEILENVEYFFTELKKDGLPNKFTDELEYWEAVKDELSKLLPT